MEATGRNEEETTQKDRNGANRQLKNWSEATKPRPVVRRGFGAGGGLWDEEDHRAERTREWTGLWEHGGCSTVGES